VTGMSLSPDGKLLVIRTYFRAHCFFLGNRTHNDEKLCTGKSTSLSIPIQRQGEAICFCKDSHSVLLTSEKKFRPIWQLSLPKDLEKDATQTAPANGKRK
jgi:hypothetical protein